MALVHHGQPFISEESIRIVDDLASERALAYCDKLFTPDEAAYLDYMFNNASFPNSVGLRNKYDHTSSPVSNPNAREHKQDYYLSYPAQSKSERSREGRIHYPEHYGARQGSCVFLP